jgi:hypothetical protein
MITPADVHRAHRHSSFHRAELGRSGWCGCFYCLERFDAREVAEWTDRGQTALCPYCGIDSVLGDASGYPITEEFLSAMQVRWFAVGGDEPSGACR